MKSYLRFELTANTGKTFVWCVESGGYRIGTISWHSPWRRYCFFPERQTVWDRNCLSEVIEFIDAEMAKRKAA